MRALTELARSGTAGPVPIGEIAKRRDIPVQFLEGMFATLRRAGILQSQRGVKGGYSFVRDPAEVSVLEIVQILDGEFDAEAAAAGGAVWPKAVAALRKELSGTSIGDVVQQESQAAGAQMYHI